MRNVIHLALALTSILALTSPAALNAQHLKWSAGAKEEIPCKPLTTELQTLRDRLNRFWETDVRGCMADGIGSQYHSWSKTVYFDESELKIFVAARDKVLREIVKLYVMAHEWGHHVQRANPRDYQADSVPFELQADCLAGYFIGRHTQLTQPQHSWLTVSAARISDKWWQRPDHGKSRFWAIQRGLSGVAGRRWGGGPPNELRAPLAACDVKYFDQQTRFSTFEW